MFALIVVQANRSMREKLLATENSKKEAESRLEVRNSSPTSALQLRMRRRSLQFLKARYQSLRRCRFGWRVSGVVHLPLLLTRTAVERAGQDFSVERSQLLEKIADSEVTLLYEQDFLTLCRGSSTTPSPISLWPRNCRWTGLPCPSRLGAGVASGFVPRSDCYRWKAWRLVFYSWKNFSTRSRTLRSAVAIALCRAPRYSVRGIFTAWKAAIYSEMVSTRNTELEDAIVSL